MSFSRAKRFVYKYPDIDCSPADYLLSQQFDKGCSISKCDRFQKPKDSTEATFTCSRLSDVYRSKCDKEDLHQHCTRHNKNLNETFTSGFNRNDAMRKSIKTSNKNKKNGTNRFSTNKQRKDFAENTNLYDECQEFFDDDYENLTLNSEEVDNLKILEEYEFNEVYNAVKRIQRKRMEVDKNRRSFNFEDIVLKKLESIDKNVKVIKDVATSPRKIYQKQIDYKLQSGNCNQVDLKSVVMRSIKKLHNNLENRRKLILKDSEEHILNVVSEMYASNNKTSKQIKELCNITAEELAQNLNDALESSGYEHANESDIENILEQISSDCFIEKVMGQSYQHNIISDYLEQTQEVSEEMEEDLSDITIKCMDTQQMLDFQGTLLDDMKNEIEQLKTSIF